MAVLGGLLEYSIIISAKVPDLDVGIFRKAPYLHDLSDAEEIAVMRPNVDIVQTMILDPTLRETAGDTFQLHLQSFLPDSAGDASPVV